MQEDVKRSRQQDAEEVRAHLVSLRGGAPFLSPKDSELLVRWLDEGRSVPEILLALERAAEKRRQKRSRVPLALHHARVHLGKTAPLSSPPVAAEPVLAAPVHPLKPMVDELMVMAKADPRPLRLQTLAAELFVLPTEDPEDLVRGGLRCIRSFFLEAWDQLPDAARDQRTEAAQLELQKQAAYDEATLARLAEERARDTLRREYPILSATSLVRHAKRGASA